MQIKAKLEHLNTGDTIVLANNRQVIAFKRTWEAQNGTSQLPKILSWKQYLIDCWEVEKLESKFRFISDVESRCLLSKSINKFGNYNDTQLLDEVVKNNDYCCDHIISLSKLSNCKVESSELFSKWIYQYIKTKKELSLVDINDLPIIIINSDNDYTPVNIYGFKALTPIQLSLFNKTGYNVIRADNNDNNTSTKVFSDTSEEIMAAASWANSLHISDKSLSVAIVSPQIKDIHYQLRSILDQEFNNSLTENKDKSYNISLGLPLTQYSLIQNILSILEFSHQLQIDRIQSSTFIAVASSVYVAEYTSEISPRLALVNKVLSLAVDEFSINKVKDPLSKCPKLENIIAKISARIYPHTALDIHLDEFNKILQLWGFATNRTLSSVEYQLFNKYLQTSLDLNKLSNYYNKVSPEDAIIRLNGLLDKVVFQAEGGENQIQVLGSLEAEGLHFDYAWVLGMTNNFLPSKLNSPRFIPFYISSEHEIPYCNYELISKDAQATLNGLTHLAENVVFSYAQMHLEDEQLPTPLIDFDCKVETRHHENVAELELQSIEDCITTSIKSMQIKSGVETLKDQMACPFKGFTHRLKVDSFDLPHIGIDRREQGKIIHNALQYIYQEISSKELLMKLSDNELKSIINSKIQSAIQGVSNSGFKKIEKIRISKIINKFIDEDKLRGNFEVISTEQTISADISGLNFNIRLDRLDQMDNGDKIIFDYKTGKTSISDWCNETIGEPQLPIYAISNKTDGAAFIELASNKVSFKGLSKNKDSLPPQSNRKGNCKDWPEQLEIWKHKLDSASNDFINGSAQVAPKKGACNYCNNDLLCRANK